MKKSILTLLSLMLTAGLMAIPAHPGLRTATQSDGTQVQYQVIGDEVYHYMIDTQGNLLEQNEQGDLVVAGTAPTDSEVRARRAASPRRRTAQPRRVGSSSFANRGLVILVNFSDTKFQTENTKADFDSLLNGSNYTYNGATGSVRKYYSDQSSGAFVPTFDVYGPVTLSNSATYYGRTDARVGTMVADAVNKLFSENSSIDLSLYDSDGDGYVDFVDILYAGYGAADSEYSNTVWPCEWSLTGAGRSAITHNGKTIDTFSCHQELMGSGTMAGKRAGIGTPCHEFGHVFGLPDLYDTDYAHATLGDWDLMDGGAYNNNTNTPPGFSGYERMFAGWAKSRLLNSPENTTLQELQSSQEVLVVTTTGKHNLDATAPSPSTFYILENRQQTGWDKYVPGHGMLIWKIQYSATKWENNEVNNAVVSKQGVAIMAADGEVESETYDGSVYTYGDSGDPYPGTKNVTSYTAITGYPITDIEENASIISFKFMGGATEPHTVTFDAGRYGTCSTKSLTETTSGAGIVLPAVTADTGYVFLGWGTKNNLLDADAGQTGSTYKPTKDITLYALYSPVVCSVEWDVENASVSNAISTINYSETLTTTITPNDGYILTINDIAITMGDVDLVAGTDYTFARNTLSISNVRGNLYILIIAREQGQAVACDDYSYTFTANPVVGSNTLGDYTWDITLQNENSTIQNYEEARGAHFGSKNNPAGQVSVISSNTADCSIASVTVNASRTSSGSGTVAVYLGDTQIGSSQSLTTSAANYTFSNTDLVQGNIEIRLTANKSGLYMKTIQIKYNDLTPSATDDLKSAALPYTLSGNTLTVLRPADVVIYNISGSTLLRQTTTDIASYQLQQGVYLMQLNTSEGLNTYKLFIP